MNEFVMLPGKDFKDLVQDLREAVNGLREKKEGVKDFVGNDQFIEIMGISKRTAQTWRDEGVIPFSQIGSKIYYSRKDIDALMEKHKCDLFVNSKNKK